MCRHGNTWETLAQHYSTFGKMKLLPSPRCLDHSQLFLLFKEKASKAIIHFLGSFRVGGTAPGLPSFATKLIFLGWPGLAGDHTCYVCVLRKWVIHLLNEYCNY